MKKIILLMAICGASFAGFSQAKQTKTADKNNTIAVSKDQVEDYNSVHSPAQKSELVRKQAASRKEEIKNDPSLTQEQKNEKLSQLKKETEKKIAEIDKAAPAKANPATTVTANTVEAAKTNVLE